MALSSYSELVTNVTRALVREGDVEFEQFVPTAIRLAESRMNRVLRTRQMEKLTSVTVTDGSGPLPDDFLEVRRARMGTETLESAAPDWLTEVYPYGTAGTAQFYSVIGTDIHVYPQQSGTLSLLYYQAIPALGQGNQTNWLMTRHPELYYYGALIECSAFMMEDARLPVWGQMFETAIRAVTADDTMAKYANTTSRIRGATP